MIVVPDQVSLVPDIASVEATLGQMSQEQIAEWLSQPSISARLGGQFKMSARQYEAEALLEKHPHVMLFGGARSGKTYLIVKKICSRAIEMPSRHAVLRFRFNHVVSSIARITLP